LGRKAKPFLNHQVPCPNCGKMLRVKAIRRVVVPAKPAEIQLDVSAELETQTTLPLPVVPKEGS